MKFWYKLDDTFSDETTADLVVPIETEPSVDEKYLTTIRGRITNYNNHEHVKEWHHQPVCIVVASQDRLELRIQPHHQNNLSQKMLDTQIGIIANLSSIEPACDLEARTAIKKAEDARLKEAKEKAAERIEALKALKK